MDREQVFFHFAQRHDGLMISCEVVRDVPNLDPCLDIEWAGAGNNEDLQVWFIYMLKRNLQTS